MLELLSKYQNEWRAMCISLGVPSDVIDDIIQDMYLKVYSAWSNGSKIMYNEKEPNKYYVYITLRNLYFDWLKSNNKHKVVSIDDEEVYANLIASDLEADKFVAMEKILKMIDEEVDSWEHDYDKNLFFVYYLGNVSMRDLAKHTGISLTSIFNSCRRYKRILKHKLGEDYKDFLNEDYDKIK